MLKGYVKAVFRRFRHEYRLAQAGRSLNLYEFEPHSRCRLWQHQSGECEQHDPQHGSFKLGAFHSPPGRSD